MDNRQNRGMTTDNNKVRSAASPLSAESNCIYQTQGRNRQPKYYLDQETNIRVWESWGSYNLGAENHEERTEKTENWETENWELL